MDQNTKEFLLEEYRALHLRIQTLEEEKRESERYSLLAIAAIYSWLSTHSTYSFSQVGWYLPVVITGFGLFRNFSIDTILRSIGNYLHTIELEIHPAKAGWQAHHKSKKPIPTLFLYNQYIFWVISFGLSILALFTHP